MLVLHAAALDGRLHAWGEAPPAEPTSKRGAGRSRDASRGRDRSPAAVLPFDAGEERLRDALGGSVAENGSAGHCVAWLPTAQGMPIPSSGLVADAPASTARPRLAPWSIAAVALTPADAVQLLCRCADAETLATGVAIAPDLRFWALALRLAGALVARQRFLPGIERDAAAWRAVWTPLVEGRDVERLNALAEAMPASARALTREVEGPPATPALTLLEGVLQGLVDHLARSAAPTPAAPPEPPVRLWHRPRAAVPRFESAHDAWLHALRTADGRLAGSDEELGNLAAEVREWRRPVSVSAAAPFRLSFRLEAPQGDDPWLVRYLLQARRDPSLLLPAATAWAGRKAERVLESSGVREQLLASLGQAASLCPPVEASLREPAPAGYATDAKGAHAFLTESAGALEQAGFGVLLPAWWTGKGTKVRLTARGSVRAPKMTGGGGLGLDAIVHVDWQVALGDEPLTLRELQTLARLKEPLVRVRGQWVHVSSQEIAAALDLWKRNGETARLQDLVPMALGAGAPAGPLAFEGVRATGWVGELLERLQGRTGFAELPPPEGLHGMLRPYQVRGYSWLAFLRQWGLGACLADDMGLGKTIQTLALLERERASKAGPALLVCPTSVIANWEKEAERFTPEMSVLVHHGGARVKGPEFRKAAARHALVVTSYALLGRDLELFRDVSWSAVILDEAQNVKNPETRQARAARALATGHRIALTGTPVQNHVGDLWSLMEFLNPGLLGSQAEFKRRFFVPIQASRDADALARLRCLTGPFILRRLKTDKSILADLPEKMEMKVYCTLTREQASLYAAVLREAEAALEGTAGIERKGVVLATLSKLKQVCNHPAHFLGDNSALPGRSGKLARLTEMLEELIDAGDRALVFTQFAEMGALLKTHVQESLAREVLFLHGGVPRGQRDRMVARFQSDAEAPRAFVLSLKAGGTGLNLTRASHVFHFDRWWNPAMENQATDRAFRIGQTRRVQVHKFVCRGTLEERIDEMIEAKKAVAGSVVGAGEAWLTELSTDELKQILALRPEAVGE
jgi:superfamily II DNA or RNA helicase